MNAVRLTVEDFLEVDSNFQQLVDEVIKANTSEQYKYWDDLWSRKIKPMNKRLELCGWDAKHGRLRTAEAYEDMCYVLEQLSTLK